MSRRPLLPMVLLASAAVLGGGCAAGIWVPIGPPEARVEMHGEIPAPGFVWIGGYWEWNSRWEWRPGRWERPPHPGARWIAPRWEHGARGWRWHRGRWR